MDASRVRVIVAGGAAVVVAVVAVLWVTRESPPIARDGDAEASADAGVRGEADANPEADADADAEAEAEADASARVRADAGARGTAVPATREAGVETGAPVDGGVREARTVNLDEGGDGKTIDLAKGQSVVLMLTASPTSGFDWAVLKAPAALGSPSMGFVSGGEQMGASGKRRIAWTLKDTLPAGEHAVELGYQRSFEKGVAPFKTFRFKVRAAR